MRTKLSVGLVVAWVLAAGVAGAQSLMPPMFPLAEAENEFAFDLYGQLSQRPGNLVFSPYSAANALDMVFLGAKGATADEMARVLYLNELGSADLSSSLIQEAQSRRLFQPAYIPASQMPAAPLDGFQFEDADALWGQKGEPFKPGYLASVKSGFDGDLFPVDFYNATQTAGRINGWVSEKTHGHITDLISPRAITSQTRLVLTDAVYFKAGWADDFSEAASKPGVFHVASGHDVTVRMMNKVGQYRMTRGDGMEMLEIPYRHGQASLLVILPDDPNGLAAVESEVVSGKVGDWLDYEQEFFVTMSIPAFKTESDVDLSTALKTLGMTRAFIANQANLSLIANDQAHPLYVGDVVQKAAIDVHEKGTEAAAATAVLMPLAVGLGPTLESVNFVADHPFIYIIRANGSGDILFMGRVDNPAAGAE